MTDAELNRLEHLAESQDDTITVELIAELRMERDRLKNWIARAIWLARQLESKDIPCEEWLQKSIEGVDKDVSDLERCWEE